mmetsp:Transcript_13325/g.22636  ORF Transcript_13325/g.22636 Transcript_13325/m.22636 type:complete len:489 (-) Transcript_13325:634-2100(-)
MVLLVKFVLEGAGVEVVEVGEGLSGAPGSSVDLEQLSESLLGLQNFARVNLAHVGLSAPNHGSVDLAPSHAEVALDVALAPEDGGRDDLGPQVVAQVVPIIVVLEHARDHELLRREMGRVYRMAKVIHVLKIHLLSRHLGQGLRVDYKSVPVEALGHRLSLLPCVHRTVHLGLLAHLLNLSLLGWLQLGAHPPVGDLVNRLLALEVEAHDLLGLSAGVEGVGLAAGLGGGADHLDALGVLVLGDGDLGLGGLLQLGVELLEVEALLLVEDVGEEEGDGAEENADPLEPREADLVLQQGHEETAEERRGAEGGEHEGVDLGAADEAELLEGDGGDDGGDGALAHDGDGDREQVGELVGGAELDEQPGRDLEQDEGGVDLAEGEVVEHGGPENAHRAVDQGADGADEGEELVVADLGGAVGLEGVHDVVAVEDLGERDGEDVGELLAQDDAVDGHGARELLQLVLLHVLPLRVRRLILHLVLLLLVLGHR